MHSFINPTFSQENISADNHVNWKGNQFVDFLKCNELILLNGRSTGDSSTRYILINSLGKSVIDLVRCALEGLGIVNVFKVSENATLSNHLPISIYGY